MKQTKLISEISFPTDFYLAQVVRHWPEDPGDLVPTPLGAIFDKIVFALPSVEICQTISVYREKPYGHFFHNISSSNAHGKKTAFAIAFKDKLVFHDKHFLLAT